jgi:ketosteroid isomerase-like protein
MSGVDANADKELIRSYLDAVGRLAVDEVGPLFHDEGRLVLPYAPEGIPPALVGRAAIAELYAALPKMIGALNFADYEIRATEEPGHYVARYTSDAKMKATGTSYSNTYITTVSVQDGMISELTEYFDPIRLVTAMGGRVVPPSTAT